MMNKELKQKIKAHTDDARIKELELKKKSIFPPAKFDAFIATLNVGLASTEMIDGKVPSVDKLGFLAVAAYFGSRAIGAAKYKSRIDGQMEEHIRQKEAAAEIGKAPEFREITEHAGQAEQMPQKVYDQEAESAAHRHAKAAVQ